MQHKIRITDREKRVLEAYIWAKETYDREPSLSELARILGYRSVNSVRQFFASFHRKGFDIDSYKPSTSAPLKMKSTIAIPVLGVAPCGVPFFAEQNWEGEIPVDTSLLSGKVNEYFFLKAKGDSMDLVGIEDGDYVLFRSQPTANYGEQVVALVGDEATIKIYKPGRGYIALCPKSSNHSHKTIVVSEDVKIQGVVKLVVKKDFVE